MGNRLDRGARCLIHGNQQKQNGKNSKLHALFYDPVTLTLFYKQKINEINANLLGFPANDWE